MKELIERLRYCAARAPNYSKQMFEAADALEQQASRIAELEAELAQYRSAPVVGMIGKDGFPKHPRSIPGVIEAQLYGPYKPLIIKPEES